MGRSRDPSEEATTTASGVSAAEMEGGRLRSLASRTLLTNVPMETARILTGLVNVPAARAGRDATGRAGSLTSSVEVKAGDVMSAHTSLESWETSESKLRRVEVWVQEVCEVPHEAPLAPFVGVSEVPRYPPPNYTATARDMQHGGRQAAEDEAWNYWSWLMVHQVGRKERGDGRDKKLTDAKPGCVRRRRGVQHG